MSENEKHELVKSFEPKVANWIQAIKDTEDQYYSNADVALYIAELVFNQSDFPSGYCKQIIFEAVVSAHFHNTLN